jgi:hypothetical protein
LAPTPPYTTSLSPTAVALWPQRARGALPLTLCRSKKMLRGNGTRSLVSVAGGHARQEAGCRGGSTSPSAGPSRRAHNLPHQPAGRLADCRGVGMTMRRRVHPPVRAGSVSPCEGCTGRARHPRGGEGAGCTSPQAKFSRCACPACHGHQTQCVQCMTTAEQHAKTLNPKAGLTWPGLRRRLLAAPPGDIRLRGPGWLRPGTG